MRRHLTETWLVLGVSLGASAVWALLRIVDAHEAIVERVCAGDAVGAGGAMALHFDLSFASMSKGEAGALLPGSELVHS